MLKIAKSWKQVSHLCLLKLSSTYAFLYFLPSVGTNPAVSPLSYMLCLRDHNSSDYFDRYFVWNSRNRYTLCCQPCLRNRHRTSLVSWPKNRRTIQSKLMLQLECTIVPVLSEKKLVNLPRKTVHRLAQVSSHWASKFGYHFCTLQKCKPYFEK